MINNKLTVGITQGDGNGIGYEVIIKALADARILDGFTPVIYGCLLYTSDAADE